MMLGSVTSALSGSIEALGKARGRVCNRVMERVGAGQKEGGIRDLIS